MFKWIMSVLVAGASILGIVTMFVQTPESPEEKAAAEANQLKIVATNFQFDKEVYEVAKGSKLKVVLDNKEGFHGVEIVGMNVKLEGEELTQEVTFDKEGEYEVHCIVLCGTGHADMKSKLVVK